MSITQYRTLFLTTIILNLGFTMSEIALRRTYQRECLVLGWRTPERHSALPCPLQTSFLCPPNTNSSAAAMVGPGLNLAVTKDGGTYNKLQRPQDYLLASTRPPPPKATPPASTLSSTSASKRKPDHADDISKHKRTRLGHGDEKVDNPRTWTSSKERPRGIDCGMRSLLPGLDDEEYTSDDGISEALAYLRDVR
jgi:hypothetical protein